MTEFYVYFDDWRHEWDVLDSKQKIVHGSYPTYEEARVAADQVKQWFLSKGEQ